MKYGVHFLFCCGEFEACVQQHAATNTGGQAVVYDRYPKPAAPPQRYCFAGRRRRQGEGTIPFRACSATCYESAEVCFFFAKPKPAAGTPSSFETPATIMLLFIHLLHTCRVGGACFQALRLWLVACTAGLPASACQPSSTTILPSVNAPPGRRLNIFGEKKTPRGVLRGRRKTKEKKNQGLCLFFLIWSGHPPDQTHKPRWLHDFFFLS